MIANGTKVKIKTYGKEEKPIMWDEIFEGQIGTIKHNNGEGCQYHVDFGKSLKPYSHMSHAWEFAKFWEPEFEIIQN